MMTVYLIQKQRESSKDNRLQKFKSGTSELMMKDLNWIHFLFGKKTLIMFGLSLHTPKTVLLGELKKENRTETDGLRWEQITGFFPPTRPSVRDSSNLTTTILNTMVTKWPNDTGG